MPHLHVLATPLPLCSTDVFSDMSSFLLPKKKMIGCGLPLSRLYLLSKFNAVLTIDTPTHQDKLFAQTMNTLTISICRPPDTLKNVWYDDISITMPTPWDLEACQKAEINLYARLVTPESFQPAFISPLMLPDRCAFKVEFNPYTPGEYRLEIVNSWIGASTDPNPASAGHTFEHRWTGYTYSFHCVFHHCGC